MTEQASFEEIEAFIQQFQKKKKQEKKDFLTELFKDINFIDETPEWALHPPTNDFIDEEYLKQRGFEIPDNAEHKKAIITNMKYINERLGIDFSLKEIQKEKVKGTIRSKLEDEEIEKIKNLIKNENITKINKNILQIPKPREFNFNKDIESEIYNLTHVSVDTEADNHSELILCQAFNLEAKRLVLCLLDDHYSIKTYEQQDKSEIIYMTSPNPNDALIIADIETVIASILISALQQGHKKISELFDEIQQKNILPKINYKLLYEILYDTRRTLFILHNAGYDVEQLKTAHSNAKRQLYSLKLSKPEKVKITNLYNDYQYKLSLGNIPAGFRFNLHAQKKGFHKKCKINISPAQNESYPLTFLTDTLILAFAFQEKDKSLLKLSKGTKYEKVELLTENKIFSKNDLYNFIEKDQKITDEMKYSIFDVFATISIYEKLSHRLIFTELEKIIKTKLSRTKIPLATSIYSTATVSKHTLIQYLEQKTGLDKYKIQDNVKKVRKIQQNYEKTYLGGKVEVFAHGLIQSTQKQKIYYLDFASLYPHTAWISESDFLYQTCAKNELHKHIRNNIQQTIKRIKQSANEIIEAITTNKPLRKKTFQRLIGNCTLYSNIDLQLPRKHQNKRAEINTKGKITTTLADLTTAIVRKAIETKQSLHKIMNQISFIETEFIEFPINSEYGKEFFTELYLKRKEIKKEMKKAKAKNEDEYNKLYSQQLFSKIIMNSSYGIGAEGISKEDFTGILFNPIIANGITSIARAFTSIAEIKTRYENALTIYTDTDSIIIRATEQQKKNLLSIFKKTIELKDEVEDEYSNTDVFIKKIYVAGKKKYGYLLSNGEIKFKTHGKAQYETEKFIQALEEAYRYIFTTKYTQLTTVEASKRATQKHGYLQDIHLDTQKSSIYKGLTKFNKKTITAYTFEFEKIPIYVKYHIPSDSYLVTNTRKITKGLFGKYLNIGKGKHRLIFFISIPLNVEKLIQIFIEKFYHIGMDIIFKRLKKKDKWQLFYDYIVKRLQEYQETETYDFDKSDITEYFAYNFKKLCDYLNFDYKEQINKEMLNILEYFTDYQNINQVFREIAPQKLQWYFTGNDYDFIEEKMLQHYENDFIQEKSETETFKLYKNIFTQMKKKETFIEILEDIREKKLAEWQGLEDRLQTLQETITKKKHIRKRLEKYFQFDKNRIMREINEYKETFKTTCCFSEKVKDDPIRNISKNLNQLIDTDGFSYHVTIPIPTLQFSNEIKANLDYYYSQVILNTAISATKIYYATRGKGNFRITDDNFAVCNIDNDELYNEILYKNKKHLPCPKMNTYILIPLKFLIKPILKDNKLLKQDFNCMHNEMQKYLLNNVITKTYKTFFEIDLKKYAKFEERFYKYEWQELFLGKQRFSVSIEKYSSTNYNATLLINILPEKQGFGKKRFITATIRINPLSFDLININLYKTTINNLIQSENEIIKLIKPLLLDTDIQLFGRNQSLTYSDAKEKMSFWRNLTYIMIVKNIINQKLKYASCKLTELTISKQKKIKCDTDLFMSMLQSRIIKKYHQVEKDMNAKEVLNRQKKLYVYPHKASRGISVNNISKKFAISIYAKDSRWLQSKVTRIANRRELTETQMKQILKQRLNEKLIRYEQALFGMDSILRFNFLHQIQKLIEETEKAITQIEHAQNINECYNIIDKTIPNAYTTLNTDLLQPEPPPILNAF